MRVSIYVDGGSFLDNLRGRGLSFDLDFAAMLSWIAEADDIVAMRMFLPRQPISPYPVKAANQARLVEELGTQGIDVTYSQATYRRAVLIEQHTEALLATALVEDAWADRCDRAVLVSRNAAYAAPMRSVMLAGKIAESRFFSSTIQDFDGLSDFRGARRPFSTEELLCFMRSGPVPYLVE